MNINEINKWKDSQCQRDLALLQGKYERTVRLCKAIWEHNDLIYEIKYWLNMGEINNCEVEDLWNDLDYPVQKLLITAPRFGGPFTTEERAKIKKLWEISADEL